MDLITEEIKNVETYIHSQWKNKFVTKLEVPLKDLFSEPDNNGLKHIWKFGSCDLVVFKNDKPICVFEIGGQHHFEPKQQRNDRRKWKLCEINGVKCSGNIMNGVFEKLSNRKKRLLVRKYLW